MYQLILNRKRKYPTLTFYFLKFLILTKQNKTQVSKTAEFTEFLHRFSYKSVIMKLVPNVNNKHRLISLLVTWSGGLFLELLYSNNFYKHRSFFENRFGLSNKVNNFLLCGIFFFFLENTEIKHRMCYWIGSEPNLLRSQLPWRTLKTFIGHIKY